MANQNSNSGIHNSDRDGDSIGRFGQIMLSKPHLWGRPIIISIVAVFLWHNMPIIEGRLLPVVSVANLDVSQDKDANGWAEISGSFDKLRDCSFDTLEWFMIGEKSDSRIAVVFGTTASHGKGIVRFNDWQLQMPYEQVKNKSYAVAYHRCNPLWKTQTKFYP